MSQARFTKYARSELLGQTYTEEAYGVLIHAVADTRRLPEYWLSRLR